jgi:hypothetical protein
MQPHHRNGDKNGQTLLNRINVGLLAQAPHRNIEDVHARLTKSWRALRMMKINIAFESFVKSSERVPDASLVPC